MLTPLGAPPADREGAIKWQVNSLKAIGSPVYPFDEAAAIERAILSWDRDHDPLGIVRQAIAVLKSGDRTELLRKLNLPTLVMHGKSDKMVDVSGGIATAEAIPDSKLILFEGMGHGFPQALWSKISNAIAEHILGVEAKVSL